MIFNGTEIEKVIFNGTEVDEILINGIAVFSAFDPITDCPNPTAFDGTTISYSQINLSWVNPS